METPTVGPDEGSNTADAAAFGDAMTAGGEGRPGRRFLRVLVLNLLLSFVGAGALAILGEVWLRRSYPFVANRASLRFVPGVGVMLEPHREVRLTNLFSFWTITRANRLGFLDREPVTPERAMSSCHIALVGDSFIEAREVGVPVKVQVQLEALAARERPERDLTTSAFGIRGTSQIHQIPLYDTFVRPLRPKVVVLQATTNDHVGNSGVWNEWAWGAPWAASYARPERGTDGRIGLRHPDGASRVLNARLDAASRRQMALRRASFFWNLLERDRIAGTLVDWSNWRRHERWRRLAGETASLSGWRPPVGGPVGVAVANGVIAARRAGTGLVPAYAEALELTGFALDEFVARAARDGSHLVLFLHYSFGVMGDVAMKTLAEERGIPVVDQYEYITGTAGGEWRDAEFRRDIHWNPQGHRWAAEALWEYLKARPSLCGPAEAGGSPNLVSRESGAP